METVPSADGTTVAFERQGNGPPLVLVLGAFCDRNSPKTLAERLAPNFEVYRYDRRGRGDSGDTFPYAVDREVEDLQAVTRAAGGQPYVFGHSSGAILALEAAAQSVAMARLAVYEPPFIDDGSRERHAPDLAARLAGLTAAGRAEDAVDAFLTEAIGVPEATLALVHDQPSWPGMVALAHTLPYDVVLANNQSMPVGRLSRIRVPTLLMAGGASAPWARHAIDEVAREVPGAETLILEGETHGVRDDALAPVLEKFFA
jgi:pimeloyl-ACP methyl ester carboxylesterase